MLDLLQEQRPDILLLQEIKCTEDQFPFLEVEDMGYKCYILGQKSYNGVAIISRYDCEDITLGIPGFEDEQARYIEGLINAKGHMLRVASVYVPNGQSLDSDKFDYKMKFLDALYKHLQQLNTLEDKTFIAGDYNVAPHEIDVYDAAKLAGTIGFHPDERAKLHTIINDGFYDAFRARHPKKIEFSWWDYRANSMEHNLGMRIDLVLVSAEAMDVIQDVQILSKYRTLPKPSDHAPILTLVE